MSMSGALKRAMIAYYDFTVAYENLLRPEVAVANINTDWFGVDVTCKDGQCVFNQWAPQLGQVATVGRHVGGKDVIHLLSYRNATHLDWCDTKGDQGEPDALQDIAVSIVASKQPARVWCASPDNQQGAAMELEFTYSGGQVELTIPAMKYYTMLVFEY